ncbi:hypothetical protein [Petroclostridium sp. X23]|uniref:hypothetical protein n=1 Tax=Petroclostridium sp. X23 TaxID=3045146 RepID=UPI0024ACE0DD|nr:hypothetical protein [Petroclostridium sp. X23]WHH61184.1 hypothetical protein QKW49_10975 [Petroclostridium sp. X23]
MNMKHLKFMICLITGVVIGIVLGVISLTVLVSYRMDMYSERISYLEAVVQDKDARLKKLEESINNTRFILKDVEVILVYEGDNIEKIDLEKHIKGKYNALVGKEVKSIDMDMAAAIIDNRIMRLGDQEYKLAVKKVMLSDVLKLWIEVDVKSPDSSE